MTHIQIDLCEHKFNIHLQCDSKKSPPLRFATFFPKQVGICNQFLHTYYMFLFTLNYTFLFNYLQL